MSTDEQIVNYMKERYNYAKTVASVIAVQLFALAVYFCIYALIAGGVFYSLSEKTGKIISVALAFAIAAGICVINVMTVIRSKSVYISRPDAIALREYKETVRYAYDTARPVLIYKITYSLVIVGASGLVYIMLLIGMEDKNLAGMYGRIVCCLALAVAILIAYPCFDRIGCYRALLGETHELITDNKQSKAFGYVASFALPLSLFTWYALRFYGPRGDIAWAVFPFTALFALAFIFLANWTGSGDTNE